MVDLSSVISTLPPPEDTYGNILATAHQLTDMRYSAIWLEGKRPLEPSWQKLPTMNAEKIDITYCAGFNVGLRCGKWSSPKPGFGLVVIDKDVYDAQYAEAAHAKVKELTGGTLGHCVITGSGKGGGHYYYACPLDKLPRGSRKVIAQSDEIVTIIKDGVPKQKHAWVIEVLSTGAQAVAPPSVHPDSGKCYQWENGAPPVNGLPEIPEKLLNLLHEASKPKKQQEQGQPTGKHPLEACLFIQHCQKGATTLSEPLWHAAGCNLAVTDGGRAFFHKISQPYSSYTPEETDAKLDRAIKEGKPHTCMTIGELGYQCSNMQPDGRCRIHGGHAPAVFDTTDQIQGMVARLNLSHAVIHAQRTLVLREQFDPCMRRTTYETESLESFRNWYLNETIDNKSIANQWLKHPNRRQYNGLVFAPGEEHPGFFNLFRGFPIDPKPGDSSLYWELVKTVICGGNEKYYTYVRKWLAHLFQKPNVLPETAIVLRGKQGTGKNTFVGAIGRLVGQHYLELVNMNQLVGRFNSHLKDALFVHANEAVWGGDKQSVGAIKAMITDPITAVEQKGRDIIQLKNYKRLVVSSNENWSVPRDLDDRRFFPLDVSDCHKEDKPYFAKIYQSLEGDGLAALMHDLMAENISGFDTRAIPQNNNGLDLKLLSSGSVTKWLYEVLTDGKLEWFDPSKLGTKTPDWPDTIPKAILHDRYLKWCNDQKINHPEVQSIFGKQLGELIPGLSASQPKRNGSRARVYVLPSLDDCRKGFEKKAKLEGFNWDTAI